MGKLPSGDLEEWERAGRLLRVLDEERFERILRVSQRIVNAQLAALPSGMVVVDGDSSTDVS